jgi:hypothetical protein
MCLPLTSDMISPGKVRDFVVVLPFLVVLVKVLCWVECASVHSSNTTHVHELLEIVQETVFEQRR